MRRWKITGYDGLEETFSTTITGNMAGEEAISRILQALTARHLTENEVVDALRPTSTDARLEVRRDHGSVRVVLMCGQNPHYTAVLEQAD